MMGKNFEVEFDEEDLKGELAELNEMDDDNRETFVNLGQPDLKDKDQT